VPADRRIGMIRRRELELRLAPCGSFISMRTIEIRNESAFCNYDAGVLVHGIFNLPTLKELESLTIATIPV